MLFFMSVGMLVDLGHILPRLQLVLAATLALVTLKALILFALTRLFGIPLPLASNTALHLAQGGEFAFVLFALAMQGAVLPPETGHFLVAVVALSMAATPLLAEAGRRLSTLMLKRGVTGQPGLAARSGARSGHLVIAGYGRVGRTVARMIEEAGRSWVAIDRDSDLVEGCRRSGLPVFFGDASQENLLDAADIGSARGLVITLDDPVVARLVLLAARRRLPDLPIIVRARDESHMQELALGGATSVQPETTEASLLLGKAALSIFGESEASSQMVVDKVRDTFLRNT